eukprot:TRINITY_DN1268_c1_g1_i3.p1 TRINITY_DN1268_c1_g1~~TRINITY_DN1268_c1_g1_i3.p1  ORF type:complete len:1001 (-),score=270.46 TRINITY_DN1268_c1_g1_i3:38-3040(-)
MMRRGKRIELSGVEVTRMGQRGVLARYPVHFHNMRFAFDVKPFIKDSSIHDNFQRCLVVHESHGVTVQNNVAYNTTGHCYFLEDGGEHGNVFNSNIGILANSIAGANQLLPSDDRAAIFWITNPNNTWINNVAVEGTHGFWFAMPQKPRNLGKIYWDSDPFMSPRRIPLGAFEGNVAHSNLQNGLHIDEMEAADGTTEIADYIPQLGPYTDVYPYGGAYVEARFSKIIAYKNRDSAVWGKTGLHFTECIFQDNSRGFMVNGKTVLSYSHITGETDNVGNPISLWGQPALARSYPSRWGTYGELLEGHSSYDNGGPQFSVGNVFENFVSTPARRAAALVPLQHGPFMLYPRNHFGHNLTFINSNRIYINYGNNDCEYGWNVLDADGSVTGIPGGAWIQSNETHFQREGCEWKVEWNAYVCPLFGEGYVQFSLVSPTFPGAAGGAGTGYDIPKTGARTIRGIVRPLGSDYYSGPKGEMQGGVLSSGFQYMHNVIARRSYSFEFYTDDGTPSFTPSTFSLFLGSSNPGDWVVFALPYPSGTTFTISKIRYPAGNNAPVDSFSKLTTNTYFFDNVTNHLYLLLQNDYSGQEFSDLFGYGVADAGFYNPLFIKASCGSKCQPTLTGVPPQFTLPPNLISETYSATLQGCQSLDSTDSQNAGKAFFFLHPNAESGNKELHYRIHHDLEGSGYSLSILNGPISQKGLSLVSQSIPFSTTGSSGIWYISRAQWEKLARGLLYVSLSDFNGKEILRGQIECSGTCSNPPKAYSDLSDACKPAYDTLSIYSENSLASPIDFTAWDKTNLTTNFAYTSDVLCGSTSLRFEFAPYANAFLVHWYNSAKDLVLDPKFKSLEFFAKVAPGFGSIPISVGSYSEYSEQTSNPMGPQNVDNFVLDETTWSRVRIPISKLGFGKFIGKVKSVYISFNQYPYKAGALLIDEWRWSTEEDTAISELSSFEIRKSSVICTDSPSGFTSIVGNEDGKTALLSSSSMINLPVILIVLIQLLL